MPGGGPAHNFEVNPQLSPYTAFVALTIGSLIVTAALAYLAAQDDRLAGFRTLSASYGLSTLRFGATLAAPLLGVVAVPLADSLHAAAAALMAIAAARIAGVPERRTAVVAAALAAAVWTALAGIEGLGRLAAQAPLALLTGAAQIHLAWALWRLSRRSEFGGFRIVGAVAFVHGLHKLDVPVWPAAPEWQFWGLVLGGTLYIGTGVGLLVAAQRAQFLSTRAAIREARAEHERFGMLIELSPVPIIISQLADGRVRLVNESWCALTGYAREEVVGQTSLALGLWPQPDRRAGMVAALARGERVRGLRRQLRRKDGRTLELLYSAEPIAWDGEQAFVGISIDITELETARRAAQASSESFEALFRLSPNPNFVTTLAEGRYLAANDAWCRASGYAREELIGRTGAELGLWIDPRERETFLERLRREGAMRDFATQYRTRAGEKRTALLSSELLDWEGERALIFSLQDITELRNVEDEIRRLNASLEDKVRERTAEIESFSYTVSHDLRAPLRHLSGFAGLLRERPAVQADPEAMKYAERLGASARRLGHMVDSLLEYSRLGRNPIALRDVDLGAEAQLIIGELGAQAPERRVRWTVGTLPVVRGDSTLLRSVLQNLLDNALKYTRTRGEAVIEVGSRPANGEWIVHVRDNGVGFDMRYAGKLFGVFQRLHGEREFEGTGIGLAHAARIVQRHGGRIWCDAAPEQGACFFFTLPR